MEKEFEDVDPEVQELLEELANETLTENQWKVLREYVRCDPAVRAAYLETISFEAILHKEFSGAMSIVPDEPIPSRMQKLWVPVSLGAAAAILLGLYLSPQKTSSSTERGIASDTSAAAAPIEAVKSTVARITASDDVEWVGRDAMPVGTWLKPGKYELGRGNAEITFDSGASVVMTPNTIFEVVDSNKGFLHKGKLSSYVPEAAIGFLMETPEGRIQDLGTKFGLSVDAKGATDVHVLEGLVEAGNTESDEPTTVVTAKQAVRLEKEKAPSRLDYLGDSYMISVSNEVGSISSPYIHYSFDDLQPDRPLAEDTGFQTDGSMYSAEIITPKKASPTWSSTNGRFGKAIYLTGDATYLRAKKYRKITGNAARTIAFWVKIPPNAKTSNAYSFAAWGQPKTLTGQKWQVGWNANKRRNCGVKGAIRTEFGKGYVTGSTDLRDGRWHHVVSVYLGDNGEHISSQIRHYVDGKLEVVSGYNDADAEINTSGEYKPLLIGRYLDFQHPTFKGMKAWMDEFYIFEAALTPEQINALYTENRVPEEGQYLPSLFTY